MERKLKVSSNPHIRSKVTTNGIMMAVALAACGGSKKDESRTAPSAETEAAADENEDKGEEDSK